VADTNRVAQPEQDLADHLAGTVEDRGDGTAPPLEQTGHGAGLPEEDLAHEIERAVGLVRGQVDGVELPDGQAPRAISASAHALRGFEEIYVNMVA